MSNHASERQALVNAIDYFIVLLKKANGWDPLNQSFPCGCILPDLSMQDIETYRNKLDPSITSAADEYLKMVKDDISDIHAKYGTIHFNSLGYLLQADANYDPYNFKSRKYAPIKIFRYPRINDSNKFSDFGLEIFFDVASFSIDYDFRPALEYHLIRFNDIKLSLEPSSPDPNDLDSSGKPKLTPIFSTPPIEMTVELRIPKSLDFTVSFPDIHFNFSGFQIDLDLNFPSLHLDWSPLKLNLPGWLNWPFGPISFGSIFSSNFNLQCDIAFAGSDWFKFPKLNMNLDFFKKILIRLRGLLGFLSSGDTQIDYFAMREPKASSAMIPDWVAIYVNLTDMAASILGGYKPKQLHVLIGFHKSGQLKVGLLSWTPSIGVFDNKSLLFQSAMQLDFELKEDKSVEVHPGFSVEVLSGQKYADLASWANCTSPPIPAEVSYGSFSAQADRLVLEWDRAEKDYVFFLEGSITIKELLKDTGTSGDLTLPIKGIGISSSGRLVLKNTWISLDNALQVKVDDFGEVVLFLRRFGYGKRDSGAYWFGFSGDIELPVLGVKAGVERLVFTSDGDYELAGVRIDLDLANALTVGGAAAWGEGLNVPPVPGTKLDGFGGGLNLFIKPLSFGTRLEMTYVNCTMPSKRFVAWSFYLDVPLPTVIPVCFCLGINSLGLMLGQNYIPLCKQNKIPVQKWLAEGFDGNVDNILNILKYWSVESNAFAAGFSIGLATTADAGYILNGRAILVLVVPGPIVMIAGKANILSKANPGKSGAFDLLIVYDQSDPGILVNLAFRYDIKYLVNIQGMLEIYFSFTRAGDWHFYLGTPAHPVAARILHIFEAKGYLTIDPSKLSAGAMVQYGNKWDVGPITVKYYICFSGTFVISWNPAFVYSSVSVKGEAAIRIFGFGLGVGLRAGLAIKAPAPWYLFAEVEAKFSISLLFFSWSWTAHFDLSWGTDREHPKVFLENVHEKSSYLTMTSSSVSSGSSLLADSNGGQPEYHLPMDAVIGLKFLRDIDIDASNADFPTLAAYTPVTVRDEVSKDAEGLKRFHGKLKGFKIQSETGGVWAPITDDLFFSWTPTDANERRKLIVRDFDSGYSQFCLNGDPNASVQLTCPEFYQTDSMLLFRADSQVLEPYQGAFAVDSPLVLPCGPPGEVEVSLPTNGLQIAAFKLRYPDFTLKVSSDPAIQLNRQSDLAIHVENGVEIEFSELSAHVLFTFTPDQPLAAGAPVADYLTVFDDTGKDITNSRNCLPRPAAGGIEFYLAAIENGPAFSTQLPPRNGIKRLVFKQAGAISESVYKKRGKYNIALYPLEALNEIHRRNVERLEQKAKLEYVFGQNGDPGKILWGAGRYRMQGKAIWATDLGDRDPMTGDSAELDQEFKVIKPFEMKEIEVSGEKRKVQPFNDYLRAIKPAEGARPVYRQQLPTVAFRCNYVNAMLQKADYRLTMVLEDAEGKPCEYTKVILEIVPFKQAFAAALSALSGRFNASIFENIDGFMANSAELIGGADPKDFKSLCDKNLVPLLKYADESRSPIRMRVIDADRLLHYARGFRLDQEGLRDKDTQRILFELDDTLRKEFEASFDQAIFVEVKDQLCIIRRRFMRGLVEYRYCNDDLALDVSELQLSDCLAQNQPQQLNAYERGYFSPALPQGAVWDGLRPNTSYTCKFYSLDANEDLTAKREQLKAIHSLSFTTSIYRSPDELSGILDKIKLRDIVVDKALYVSTIAQLRPELALPAFAHPTQANTTFAVGMDIFRELVSANAITADEKTPHQFEEAYQSLFETYSGSVRDQLKSESLVLDGIMESMGLNLEATSPKRIIGTWFRTPEENDGSRGSIGLLLEFPEPIDWERTGFHIASAAAKINGESEEIDLLAPPTGNPSYETTFHWLRSLDGTKLMFIPKLVKTSVYNPEVVLPDDSWMIREGFGLKDRNVKEAITKEPDAEISHADFFDNISKSSTDGIKPQIAIPNSRRISDYAVVTSSAATKSEIIERLKANYGTTVVRNIYDYEIQDLELHMYYFSDNYPDENVNFRAIPRIRFLEGKPGNFDGRIGIIRLVR